MSKGSKAPAVSIDETDSAGAVTATYILSRPSAEAKDSSGRIDIVKPVHHDHLLARTWGELRAAFLPVGYPTSVTSDYLEYQIYVRFPFEVSLALAHESVQDSLQAFSSAIAGMLASRAVLEGVGVGDASTTPTAALLLSVTQDTASRLATILFAARIGPALAPECKAYRLLADLFNDAATLLDLAAPLAPAGWARASVLSTAGVGRALCGVAAGGAKASLSAHFAGARGNVGDLNAKDASQETVIGLAGMLAGTLVVGRVTAPVTVWAAVVGLLAVHLAMNYRAVCAVRCRVLNRQRAGLVLSGLLAAPADAPRVAMTPAEVAVRERVLEMGGELRWCGGPALGRAEIGVPLARIVGAVGGAGKGGAEPRLSHLQDVMAGEGHMLWWDGRQERALLVLKQGVSAEGQLKAWAHALLVAREWSEGKADEKSRGPGEVLRLVTSTLEALNRRWAREVKEMRERGWDVDTASLETRPGTRVRTGER